MTKKDYIKIAGIFARFGNLMGIKENMPLIAMRNNLVQTFADMLSEDNPM